MNTRGRLPRVRGRQPSAPHPQSLVGRVYSIFASCSSYFSYVRANDFGLLRLLNLPRREVSAPQVGGVVAAAAGAGQGRAAAVEAGEGPTYGATKQGWSTSCCCRGALHCPSCSSQGTHHTTHDSPCSSRSGRSPPVLSSLEQLSDNHTDAN